MFFPYQNPASPFFYYSFITLLLLLSSSSYLLLLSGYYVMFHENVRILSIRQFISSVHCCNTGKYSLSICAYDTMTTKVYEYVELKFFNLVRGSSRVIYVSYYSQCLSFYSVSRVRGRCCNSIKILFFSSSSSVQRYRSGTFRFLMLFAFRNNELKRHHV